MNKTAKLCITLFFYSFLLMLLCAGSSPLIQYLSPDSSIFFTMGRSAASGTVLYKEIADHKGFYLFLFNWVGAWLTPGSMNGLFVVEVLFAWMKVFFLYKTVAIYEQNSRKCILAVMMFMTVATNFLSWNTGDLGEQFALVFQLISLYYMACYIHENDKAGCICEHKSFYMLIHGFCAGVVLFIQANLIAMWIPFGIGLAVILLSNRHIRNFFHNLIFMLLGAGVASLPVFIYGMVHDCIRDMYYVMFEINFLYSADGRAGKALFPYLREFLLSPSGVVVFLAVAGTLTACLYYKKKYIAFTMCGMLLFSIVCMSVSLNANPIYYTVYMPFMLPLFIRIAGMMKEKRVIAIGVIVFGITVICNLQLVKKALRIGTSSYAYESAYQMADLIDNKDAKILVLGNSLYYNCTNTLPHIRYFTIFGSGLRYETFPYCIDEQYDSLCSGENEYVMVQFLNDGYTFWNDEERDTGMNACLENMYHMELEYRDGGIHSALYKRK